VLSKHATDQGDARTFFRAAMFNAIIGGTDAHGKNYSIILGPATVQLAPLYDINSLLPYPEFSSRSRLAMSVGGRYRTGEIQPRHWMKEAEKSGLDPEQALRLQPDGRHAAICRGRSEGRLQCSRHRVTAPGCVDRKNLGAVPRYQALSRSPPPMVTL